MKTKMMVLAALMLVAVSSSVYAKPEMIHIKDANRRKNEETAKAQIKNLDLQNIEDPEARKAIQQILNYLNLSTK